jgi:glycosyltransferase involved in cell wall biosynthesis
MHIALIVVYYPPNTTSTAKLMKDLADELVRMGHHVTVITVADDLKVPLTIEKDGALTVLRIRTGKIRGAPKFTRAMNEMRLSSTIWKAAGSHLRSIHADLVVYYSPSIFFSSLVMRLKRLWAANAYMVLRDIFPEWAVEAGILRKGLIYRYFKRCERINYDAADWIGVQSPANVGYFNQLSPKHSKIVEVLYNWTADNLPRKSKRSYRAQFGLEGKIVFFYGGNIGVAQDMGNILRLAASLRNESYIHFLLVGEGGEVARVRSEIRRSDLSNVSLHPSVSQDEYLAMLQEFDVALISLDRRLKSANIPGKLLGYFQCGLPTLASINPGNDLRALLEEGGVGLVSDNGEDEIFRENAIRLARDAQLRERMGGEARELLYRRFHVSAAAQQIVRAFERGWAMDPKQDAYPIRRAEPVSG